MARKENGPDVQNKATVAAGVPLDAITEAGYGCRLMTARDLRFRPAVGSVKGRRAKTSGMTNLGVVIAGSRPSRMVMVQGCAIVGSTVTSGRP